MAGGLPSTDTPTHIARQALLGQLDKTLQSLREHRQSDSTIHEIRKELKRARATLRMLRECIGVAAYRRNNALLRDAARPLTPVRDAKVLLDAVEREDLKKRANGANFMGRFYKLLEKKRRIARRQLHASELTAAARVVRAIRRRAAALPASRLATIDATSLERAYKKARNAFADARRQGTDLSLHEWRKQTKYFANQLELVLPFGPQRLEKDHQQAKHLADCLGDDHDLAILTEQIYSCAKGKDAPGTNAEVRDAIAFLARRRKKLQAQALRLGRRLYSGKAARYQLRRWRDPHEA